MAGEHDPIKLSAEQEEMLNKMQGIIRDLEFELDQASKAGLDDALDIATKRDDLARRKMEVQGMLRVYGCAAKTGR